MPLEVLTDIPQKIEMIGMRDIITLKSFELPVTRIPLAVTNLHGGS